MPKTDGNIKINGCVRCGFQTYVVLKGSKYQWRIVEADTQKLFLCANTLNRAAATVHLAMSIVFLSRGFAESYLACLCSMFRLL